MGSATTPRLRSATDIERILASIRKWGWTNPVLVRTVFGAQRENDSWLLNVASKPRSTSVMASPFEPAARRPYCTSVANPVEWNYWVASRLSSVLSRSAPLPSATIINLGARPDRGASPGRSRRKSSRGRES
jgi:hypothetical protein